MDIYSTCDPDIMHRLSANGDLSQIGAMLGGVSLLGCDLINHIHDMWGFGVLTSVLSVGI